MSYIVINDRVGLSLGEWGACSHFHDGTSYGAHPHDTHHYHVISHRTGYGADILRYSQEHELIHHLVGEIFYDGVSPIIWALAHGEEVGPEAAALEESMVMLIQRWIRANEQPIIGGVDWGAIKDRALRLLGDWGDRSHRCDQVEQDAG